MFEYRPAINYSGYREKQSPRYQTFPSKQEILEDLTLLQGEFYYLRIYDCTPHAYRTLEVITENNLNFKVMLGLSLAAEENHIKHPWHYKYPKKLLRKFKKQNKQRVQEIIVLANQYESIVSSISIGNEIRSEWSNRRLPIKRMVAIVNTIQSNTSVPVTYCEEYQVWTKELAPVAKVVDFISLHTYPAWQGNTIDIALNTAINDYNEVQQAFPDTPCIITETGWPTSSHGSKIKKENATIDNQHIYNKQISDWAKQNNVLVYLFEAFDEPWKGGDDPDEPEKHWGIYYVDRTRK